MSDDVQPGEVYLPVSRVNALLVDIQASNLAGIEVAVGVIRATAADRKKAADVSRTLHQIESAGQTEAYARGLTAAADILRAVIDEMLEAPLQVAASGVSPLEDSDV